jgi:hypothetical protein
MKKITIFILILLASMHFSFAQTMVETIELKGRKYTVSKQFPPEITGKYLYEGKSEPIVLLNPDGTGLFQPHQVDPIKIKFWIDCDENGAVRVQKGAEGRYQYTLLIQYLDGDNGNYPAGKYDLMGVLIIKDEGRAVIYGERYKNLP